MQEAKQQLTFIDLFAGIGGFRLGLEQAGHKCLGHCEKYKFANKSYRAMHRPKEDEWFAEDIAKVRANNIPAADVWTFGFPCQDISVAGKQTGFRGNRSSMFFTTTKLIRELEEKDMPSYLLIENVKNLLSVNRGWDFAKLLIELDEIGYDAEWQLINSKNFGVPQNRERVFIVGHLRGRRTRKVFPIEGTDGKNLIKLIDGPHSQRVYSPEGISMTLAAQGGGQGAKTGLYAVESKSKSGIINTLASGHGNMPKVAMQQADDICIRKLTPLECFRLQGVTDELFYRAQKVNSDNQLYKQAGNMVTVPVIKAIGSKLHIKIGNKCN